MAKKKPPTIPATLPRTGLSEGLLWLADAPLFIDADQVARFHDAVVRPEYEIGSTTLELSKEKTTELAGKLGLDLSIEPTKLLSLLAIAVPFIKADLKASGEGSGRRARRTSDAQQYDLRPINTPQRQLEQLVLHYLANHLDRLLGLNPGKEPNWKSPEVALKVPRAVVMLDLPAGTKFIPTAIEFMSGRIDLVYKKMAGEGAEPPKYPEPSPAINADALVKLRQEYWAWFDANFNATKAMLAVEAACANEKGGLIRWIDYRVPVGAIGETAHLHVAPNGKYDTGTFAYYLIKRGFKHGVRLVCTLREEPDLNVLAVYEK